MTIPQKWQNKEIQQSSDCIVNLIGRELNSLQEFENKSSHYFEQTLLSPEAKRIITGWHRNEWHESPLSLFLIRRFATLFSEER